MYLGHTYIGEIKHLPMCMHAHTYMRLAQICPRLSFLTLCAEKIGGRENGDIEKVFFQHTAYTIYIFPEIYFSFTSLSYQDVSKESSTRYIQLNDRSIDLTSICGFFYTIVSNVFLRWYQLLDGQFRQGSIPIGNILKPSNRRFFFNILVLHIDICIFVSFLLLNHVEGW